MEKCDTHGKLFIKYGVIYCGHQESGRKRNSLYECTIYGGRDFLKTLKIKIMQGIEPDRALEQFKNPTYITQKYADLLVPPRRKPGWPTAE